jgi:hypothetical protein
VTTRDKVARSCYTSYHETGRRLAPDFGLIHEFDKLRWLMTADRVLAQLPAIATLTQRVAELEAALRDYGSHDNGCTFYDSMQDHCSCGYSKALARARPPIT